VIFDDSIRFIFSITTLDILFIQFKSSTCPDLNQKIIDLIVSSLHFAKFTALAAMVTAALASRRWRGGRRFKDQHHETACCSLLRVSVLSPLSPKVEMRGAKTNVCFDPQADMTQQQKDRLAAVPPLGNIVF